MGKEQDDMTPTLFGRIQTRLFLLATFGLIWTLLIGLVLPRPEGATLNDQYKTLLTALLIVGVVGIIWELIYHALQQLRWEKDWPTIFGLFVAVPEGIVAYVLLQNNIPWDVGGVALNAFLPMFITVWLLVWAIANGPMQIFFIRWRYRGGRLNPRW